MLLVLGKKDDGLGGHAWAYKDFTINVHVHLLFSSSTLILSCIQDPADKKVIVCDEKLKVLFAGRERVGFLEVAKLLNPHFVKVP
jgi:chromatin remodeling complex protein RSC6